MSEDINSPSIRPKPKPLDQMRERIRAKHYSIRTEEAYVQWIRSFTLFHDKRHPREMGGTGINAFLSSLAVDRHVSASTRNQALCAILFLHKEVLGRDIDLPEGLIRAKRPQRLPVVLTKEEVRPLLGHMADLPRMMAYPLYGAGLRLMECVRLRVRTYMM